VGAASIARRAPTLLAAALLALAPACRKGSEPQRAAPSPSPSDRFADGKRLAAALADWKNRWQNELAPPSCDAVLPKHDERQLCALSAAALTRVQAHAATLDAGDDTLRAAAELSRTASAAARKLRFRDMEYMGTEGLSLPTLAPSASGAPPPTRSSHAAPPRPLPFPSASASVDAGVEGATRRDDPFKPVLRAYARLEVEALRYLAAFLELAPLPTRSRALEELEKLWDESGGHPSHPLQQIVRQASLLETDAAFKARLLRLDAKSHRAPPTPSAR
jgi:hypothetical protein